ncbi:uncharacterized protein LOC143996912 [Lithobates pipiens]
MILHWHLPCFIFGNVWCLLYATDIQVNRANFKLVCSDNTLLLCSSKEDRTCVDASLCMLGPEKQINKSREDHLKWLRHVLCNEPASNCLFTENGDYKCNLGEHQNNTAILKVTDCWKHNMKTSTLILEVMCSFILFLSIMALFLSYLCLKKAVHKTFTDTQKSSLHIRCNLTDEAEPV